MYFTSLGMKSSFQLSVEGRDVNLARSYGIEKKSTIHRVEAVDFFIRA